MFDHLGAYCRKFEKYGTALYAHAAKLLRLAPAALAQHPSGKDTAHYLNYLAQISNAYFGNSSYLSALTLYRELGPEQRSSRLWLNLVPLPPRLERKIYGRSILEAHHAARLDLVRSQLPSQRRILDLGGADATQECGALLAMGYAHAPERIHIVDLVPEQRLFDPSKLAPIASYQHGSTQVTYSYHSMAELPASAAEDGFDMIWMGQTAEHITTADLKLILGQAATLLPVGGRFCLDTPNRLLTKLLDPRHFIHPDHKHEYECRELSQLIESFGFRLERSLAVSPLPLSRQSGYLHRLEFLHSPLLGPHADDGFSFYLQFVRV